MAIEVKIFKIHQWGEVSDSDVLGASGKTAVGNMITWFVEHFAPSYLVNGMSGSVTLIKKNRVVIYSSYRLTQGLDGIIEVTEMKDLDPYGWRYEITGVPDWRDEYFAQTGTTADFELLRSLIGTYAKAWGQEYPRELGSVIDQLIALEESV